MRGFWARSPTAWAAADCGEQQRHRTLRLWQGSRKGKDGGKGYTRSRERSSSFEEHLQPTNTGTRKRSRGAAERRKHWNSKFWLQNPISFQNDSIALSSFLLKKYIKPDSNFSILIFKSSQCYVRESLASSLRSRFPAKEIPEAKHLIHGVSSHWYGNQMGRRFTPLQFYAWA